MLSLLLLLLLSEAKSQQLPKNIFILAGQSNMAGRGGVTGNISWDGIVPPQSQPNPSISRLTADLTWVLAKEPLHADIDYNKTNGVGPGMAFANAILTKDPTIGTLGLVPCAIGGTNISQWGKGGFLYEQLLRRTEAAVNGGGVIRGMLWYQGESDTMVEDDAHAYRGRLIKFFQEIRVDLNHPSLRIIQVGLASGEGPFVEEIRKAQLGIKVKNVQSVDAKGLPLGPDRLHLTTPAEVHLGQMLADAFLHSSSSSMFSIHATTDSSSLSTQISHHNFLFVLLMFIFLCF
ncbi:hypothetical protein M5689_016745 [Euphorbia peplus]|nr:hypothetical protein M5689_016745 [Euphorbia peplus]